MKNQALQTLTEKEVSRKEFLGIATLAIGSIFGFGTLIKLLTGKSLSASGIQQAGYGGKNYGGK